MKKNKIIRISFFLFFLLATALLAASLSGFNYLSLLYISALWIAVYLVFLFKDIHKNIFFICFLVCFFVFLVGSDLIEILNTGTFMNKLTLQTRTHGYFCLVLSVVFLMIGHSISFDKNIEHNESDEKNAIHIESLRKASKYIFYASYILYLTSLLEVVVFVQRNGYDAFYTSFVSKIPTIISKIGDICPLGFYIFLGTMPKKKEALLPEILMGLYCAFNLLTGKRFLTVVYFVFLIAYFIKRNKYFSNGEKWLKKKYLILISVFAFLGIAFLSWYGNYRMNWANSESLFDNFLNFFIQTGKSNTVIFYGYDYQNSMPHQNGYLFGNLYDYFLSYFDNTLVRGQTASYAINGHGYSYALSYIFYGDKYLQGYGLGSCYIAEAYFDLGYFGVAVVNLFIGIFFKNFQFNKNKPFISGIFLYLLPSVLLMPRGNFDKFLCEIINIKILFFLFIIYLLSNSLCTRRTIYLRRN